MAGGSWIVNTTGLPDGYVPPSASLSPPPIPVDVDRLADALLTASPARSEAPMTSSSDPLPDAAGTSRVMCVHADGSEHLASVDRDGFAYLCDHARLDAIQRNRGRL